MPQTFVLSSWKTTISFETVTRPPLSRCGTRGIPYHACVRLWPEHVFERGLALRDGTDAREDDAAHARRNAGCLEHVPGVLSGDAAGGLSLCACLVELA